MGASLVHHDKVTAPITTLAEFHEHIQYMQGFHQRYMVSSKVCRYWVNMVREMDINAIVPQHGRWFQGKPAVKAFLDWIATLECGIDNFDQSNYKMPR
jgi:flavorubredoxin